jgi:formylglycine-generating enzyme required for sulfatase activity
MPRRAFPSARTFASLSRAARLEWSRRVAARLGAGFCAEATLAGRGEQCAVRHLDTDQAMVVVPGGRARVGVSASERRELFARMGGAGGSEGARAVERLVRSHPPRVISLPPFLVARAPVLRGLAERSLPAYADRARPFWGADSRAPACFTHPEATALARGVGLRLLTSDEWEVVARAGGPSAWIHPDPVAACRALGPRPVYGEPNDPLTENAWGVWGLLLGEWTEDVDAFRSQEPAELVRAHVCHREPPRHPDDGAVAVRLALTLPSS